MSLAPFVSTHSISAGSAHQAPGVSTPNYEEQRNRDSLLHSMSMEENEQRSLLAIERDAAENVMRLKLMTGSLSSPYDKINRSLKSGYGLASSASPHNVVRMTNNNIEIPDVNSVEENTLQDQYEKALATATMAVNLRSRGIDVADAYRDVPGEIESFGTKTPIDYSSQNVQTVFRRPLYWGDNFDYGGASESSVRAYASVGNTIDDLINFKNGI